MVFNAKPTKIIEYIQRNRVEKNYKGALFIDGVYVTARIWCRHDPYR